MSWEGLELVPTGSKWIDGRTLQGPANLVFFSLPEPSWNLWGDPEGHWAPPGKGSSARILLGNSSLILPLGIAGGWTVLSRGRRIGNLQDPIRKYFLVPTLYLARYSVTPQWEWRARRPFGHKALGLQESWVPLKQHVFIKP